MITCLKYCNHAREIQYILTITLMSAEDLCVRLVLIYMKVLKRYFSPFFFLIW